MPNPMTRLACLLPLLAAFCLLPAGACCHGRPPAAPPRLPVSVPPEAPALPAVKTPVVVPAPARPSVFPVPPPSSAFTPAKPPEPAAIKMPLAAVKNAFPQTPFYNALRTAFGKRSLTLESACDPENPVARRLLETYGAVFLAAETATPPPACIFADADAIQKFQETAGTKEAEFDGVRLTLQSAAMDALIAARDEAKLAGLSLTPRNGGEAGRRSMEESQKLWGTYVEDGLLYWLRKGKLRRSDLTRIRKLAPLAQLGEILTLEKRGIFFGLSQAKPILHSVAPPGCSQHLSLLALDVAEFADPKVREILARHGWFQTVPEDYPHFTWLGVPEEKLPELGLRKTTSAGRTFWVPALTPAPAAVRE
jgi:hypothetical protein